MENEEVNAAPDQQTPGTSLAPGENANPPQPDVATRTSDVVLTTLDRTMVYQATEPLKFTAVTVNNGENGITS